MCFALHSVSDRNIDRIQADPHLIWRLFAPDDPEVYLESLGVGKKPSFIGRLFGAKEIEAPDQVPELDFISGENLDDDLDRSWHGIHYCLNKNDSDSESPLDFITEGGTEIGDIDVGYGPARSFKSDVVKVIGEKLNDITLEKLKANYDPEDMEKLDIYPAIWDRDQDEGYNTLRNISFGSKTLSSIVRSIT